MAPSKLKGDPIKLFWDQASCWRKLVLLRLLDVLREDLAQKYLKEIVQLQDQDGGFSKNKGETSRVTETAEAIINFVKSSEESSSHRIQKAINFVTFVGTGSVSAQLGPRLAHMTSPKKFKVLLALVYLYIGLRLAIRGVYQLMGQAPPIP